MKRFLLAAFKITPFQIAFVAVMAFLKYILTAYKITDKIEKPFTWICLSAGAVFVIAAGIMGLVENRGQSFEDWEKQPKKSTGEKLMAGFASWGVAIPAALALVLFLYMITPTSVYMAIALYLGIVIRNCIAFFSTERAPQTN